MTYEHQARYRKRLLLKARYFDEAEPERKRRIREQAAGLEDTPELRHVLPYFLSHPRAVWFVGPDIGEDGWEAVVPNYCSDAAFHCALAEVAMKSLPEAPARAWIYDGVCAPRRPDPGRVETVQREIDQLRDLGMWDTSADTEAE